MVDQNRRYRSYAPDVEPNDESLTDHRLARYARQQSDGTDYPEEPSPMFRSDYDDVPDPSEFITPMRRRSYISSPIVAGVLLTAAMATVVAVFFPDAARDIFANTKHASPAVLSAASPAAQSSPTQLTAQIDSAPSKDPAPLSVPENQAPNLRSVTTTGIAPPREEVRTSRPRALQGDVPNAAAVAVIPEDAIHHLDPGEIAASLGRANDLIASGDLAAARLVLRRAANAGDARAALTIARTYDPAVLERLGVHGLVPDVAMARAWYEKAKKFGSAEAPERIEMLASQRQ